MPKKSRPLEPGYATTTALELAIARKGIAFDYLLGEIYPKLIEDNIAGRHVRFHTDPGRRSADLKIIKSEAAKRLLPLIWHRTPEFDSGLTALNSRFRTPPETIGITEAELGELLERYYASKIVQGGTEKYKQTASRVIDAALTFDLICTAEGARRNHKPYIATEKLHLLMKSYGRLCSACLRDNLIGKPDDHD